MLMREAAREFGWKLNYGAIALMWRGGCIIRRWVVTCDNQGASGGGWFCLYFEYIYVIV